MVAAETKASTALIPKNKRLPQILTQNYPSPTKFCLNVILPFSRYSKSMFFQYPPKKKKSVDPTYSFYLTCPFYHSFLYFTLLTPERLFLLHYTRLSLHVYVLSKSSLRLSSVTTLQSFHTTNEGNLPTPDDL